MHPGKGTLKRYGIKAKWLVFDMIKNVRKVDVVKATGQNGLFLWYLSERVQTGRMAQPYKAFSVVKT